MADYENVPIPFKTRGNRQYLSAEQLVEMPWLLEFILAFPKCFETDETNQVIWFWPEGDAPR